MQAITSFVLGLSMFNECDMNNLGQVTLAETCPCSLNDYMRTRFEQMALT